MKFTSLAAAIAAGLSPAGTALAQDQEEAESSAGELEEIIVTATLRRVEMQDVPQSIQAFSTEDIEANNFTSLQTVANAIPSLNIVAEMPGRNSVVFRGVSTGTQEFYTDSQVAIYFDETPLTFNSQQLWPAMVDIERVESLPGPQGTLFGSASQAGTLRIVANKPSHEGVAGQFYAEYQTTSGGEDSHHFNGWINLPLAEDTLAARLVFYNRYEGGWIDNVYGETYQSIDPSFTSPGNNADVVEDDQNTYRLKGARASLLWSVSEDWEVIFQAVNEKGRSTGHWSYDPFLGEHKVTQFFDDWREDKWWLHALTIEGDLGFATLTSSTTYLDRDIGYEWDNMRYEQWKDSYWGYYYGYAMYNTNYTYGTIFNEQYQDRLSQEFRLTSNSDSRFQWMVGAFYEDIYDEWFYGSTNPDLPDTTAWYYAAYWSYFYAYYGYDAVYPYPVHNFGYSDTLRRSVEQKAVFGEISVDVTDQLNLTFGARYFDYERDEFHQVQFLHFFPPWDSHLYGEYVGGWDWENFGVQPKKASDSDSNFKFSARYTWDEDKMVYALFSEGFRLGGQNSQRAASRGVVPLIYEPDYLDNYELGFKTDWMDKRLRLNLSMFRMDFDNFQFNQWADDEPWWVRGIVNGGEVRIEGYELEVKWAATDNLTINTSYYKADSTSQTTHAFPNGNVLSPGDELPNSPKDKMRIALDYTVPRPVFGGEMFIHFDYSEQDATWNSLTSSINKWTDGVTPSSDISNLFIGVNLPDDWQVTLSVYNLGDDLWVNSMSWVNPSDSAWFGDPRWSGMINSSRPRSYALGIRKNW